ncbi:jg1802 [Pararge aegeria aegeria]|uniref:Jg1802 protein n=1 Tax=Pararge aegeria aegeria TaxID=348720 RepID=A0A8S4RRH6_9NEOP|nr:jg1802 [Pararge aegeria aegeria]
MLPIWTHNQSASASASTPAKTRSPTSDVIQTSAHIEASEACGRITVRNPLLCNRRADVGRVSASHEAPSGRRFLYFFQT